MVCFLAPVVLRTWTPQHCPSNNTVSTKSTTTAVAPATTRDSDGSAENRRQSYSPEQDHTTITPAPTTLPPSGHIPVETGECCSEYYFIMSIQRCLMAPYYSPKKDLTR